MARRTASPRSSRPSCSSSAARPTSADVEAGRLFGVESMVRLTILNTLPTILEFAFAAGIIGFEFGWQYLLVVILTIVFAYLPMFERVDSHSIRFRAKDMVEASTIMSFIGDYRPDITP